MIKNYQRGAAVLDRVVRDPSLLTEVWSRIRSRYTNKRHQKRKDMYSQMAIDPVAALSKLLAQDPALVRENLRSESLGQLLVELEAYLVPDQGSDMGGPAFLEVCYLVARQTRPKVVLETGVAHGYSSAAILQALEDNGEGELFSVDLPVFRRGTTPYTGGAVPERLKLTGRWKLTLGPDRNVLPSLLKRIGQVDMLLYDSDKSYEGMLRTWGLVWPYMSPGAVLVLDDIHPHDAYIDFIEQRGLEPIVVSKPTNQGVYDWDRTFYVGLLRKTL